MKKLLLLLTALISVICALAQQKKVLVLEIKSEIDPRVTRYVELGLNQALEIKADVVIIELDTYGGILTDAKETVDKIMQHGRPVWVFINSDAASAGALISIACDSIYMSPGASIGAATVVDASGQKAPDKYQSYMRSIMRSTAEENGRDPKIAEGMVDEDLTIEGLKDSGEIITFSTSEALQHGYCEAKVSSINEILERNGMSQAEVTHFELGFTERVISLVINPFVSGLLILIIIAGIWFEMQHPGLGFAGLAALVALILYLVPYYLNGLAENWEIITLFLGLILLALEIFVIPGFGIAGVSGIVLMLVSLVLIMINNNAFDFQFVRTSDILIALTAATGGLLGGVILLFVVGANFADTKIYKRVALTDRQESSQGYMSNPSNKGLMGKTGVAYTVLRPSGKILIDGKMYDAHTRGDYIEKGQSVEIISDEGPSIRVKLHE